MKREFTATYGEKTIKCSASEWPSIAAQAHKEGVKSYLVRNSDNMVIAEG